MRTIINLLNVVVYWTNYSYQLEYLVFKNLFDSVSLI
jgi:hypothetical protein